MDFQEQRRTTSGPQPIHSAIRKVWLFSNLISIVIFGIVLSGLEFLFDKSFDLPWRIPILMPLLFILFGYLSTRFVKRQWENWRYEVTNDEVILSWGVWWRTRRFVPRDRVQHVDINSGPIDRRFGLAQVHLYVAGAHGSVGAIPGLTPDEAETLRSMLLETQAAHV